MSERSGPKPDTSDMAAVHRVFRTALGSAPSIVASAGGDGGRRALVADYFVNVLAFLEVHHDGEEKLVFPILRERAPQCAALIDTMDEEHAEAVRLLGPAREAVLTWWHAPPEEADTRADSAVAALGDLAGSLFPHLDEEEAEVVPLAADHLSIEEWGALPGHGMANFTGDKIWLILGLIRENFTPAQRQAMLDHMPPPARAMWETMGEAAFASLIAEVRQTT